MKKIIPPVLFVICIVIMVGLWWVFPVVRFVTFPVSLIGILPFIVGLGIAKRGSDVFEKTGTNIETFDDPDILVTDGLYRVSHYAWKLFINSCCHWIFYRDRPLVYQV